MNSSPIRLPSSELIHRYDRPGPRYTSYPTAAQFHDGFDARSQRDALGRAGREQGELPLSVYVHVPFCSSPCFFCGCTKIITRQQTMAEAYLRRLRQESVLQAQALGRRRPIEQLHLGGGTPTFMSMAQLGGLLESLDADFGLIRGHHREYSIEIDPRTVSLKDLFELSALGFNRVSLGVQDFDLDVQHAVNRVQSAADTLALIDAARAAGMRGVSVDLIYGLPRQTPTGFARTLDQVLSTMPDRIAAYSYAHLPERFKPQQRIRAEALPSPETKLALLHMAIERLSRAGYVYIGMDHFARPDDELAQALLDGRLHRNFQGYSTRAGLDLIGLGMSAIGQLDNCYAQNARTLDGYYAALDTGELPAVRGLQLSRDDRLRREVILRIMCCGHVDFEDIERRHGIDFECYFAEALDELAPMQGDELLKLCDNRLDVLPRGRFLLRAIAMPFDAYLSHSYGSVAPKRFSSLV